MAKSIEEQIENYYKKLLDRLGITHYGKTQAPQLNKGIAAALDVAPSKSGGTGKNYPDIMFMLNNDSINRHIPVIVEAKGTKGKLEKLDGDEIVLIETWKSDSKANAKNPHKKGDPNYATITNFAVNGAYHYAKNIVESDLNTYNEIIFVGINGCELEKDNTVKNPEQKAYYLSKSNKYQPKHIPDLDKSWDLLKSSNLGNFFDILDKLTLTEEELEILTDKTEDRLEKAMKRIHQDIYDNTSLQNVLTTNEKMFLFSGLIMAGLQTEGLKRLKAEDLPSDNLERMNDGKILLDRVTTFLELRGAEQHKVEMITNLLRSVFTNPILWKNKNGSSLLKELFKSISTEIVPLLESDLKIDFTGKILNSLNEWIHIDNDKANDVVLTPRYVTELMVKLTRTNKDSYVWDTAMGSGGFLMSAMDAMIKDARATIQDRDELERKIEHIKKQQLLGMELLSNIYILAVLNMILIGDGSSNLKQGDSHSFYKKEKDFPSNVFLLNPPYSAEGKGFNFVEEAFSQMDNGYGAVLIQENAGSGLGQPFTKRILENNTLLASIHMPTDLFGKKASVQTAIYVFKVNQPHEGRNIVKFIDFSEDGYSRINRKRSSQDVNLRDTDNAKARYAEVVDIVLGYKPETSYYTIENGKLIEDTISLNGDDWTFSQHTIAKNAPKLADFKKTVADYLSWEVSNLLKNQSGDNEKLGK